MKTNEFTFTLGGNKVSESFIAKTYGKEVVSEMKKEAREFEWSERWCKTVAGGRYAIRARYNDYRPAPISDTYYEDMRSMMLY